MSKKSPPSPATAAAKRKPAASKRPAAPKSPKTKPPRIAKQQSAARPEVALPKKDQLIALLKSASGTTIDAMTHQTGWQAHTVRGVISGVLRKKLGLNVICEKADQGNRYKITASA